jgi:hypothetical protein
MVGGQVEVDPAEGHLLTAHHHDPSVRGTPPDGDRLHRGTRGRPDQLGQVR